MLFLGASSGPDQRAALLGKLLGWVGVGGMERNGFARTREIAAPPPPLSPPPPPLPLSALAQGH